MPTTRHQTRLNGVALFTMKGTPKTRFSPAERLQLLGATEADLEAFVDLFCPDRPLYAVTRPKAGDPRAWTTPRGRLPPEQVLRHLTADLTPGMPPRWIAPHSWEATWWVGIDVDCRGDLVDFQRRCDLVWKALGILGVPTKGVLVSQTPSGGRHFRFFTNRKVRVSDIPEVIERVGLKESPGQIEIFPKRNKGLRLPFGCIPGQKHDPRAWVTFIRRFKRGKVPKVNWWTCTTRAAEHHQKVLEAISRGVPTQVASSPATAPTDTRMKTSAGLMGGPKAAARGRSPTGDGDTARYLELIGQACSAPAAAMELWDLGIRAEGTRIEATKRLAWHLLFVKRLTTEDAAGQLVRWVYETGRTTSVDVGADLSAGTRKVEKETRALIAWMAEKHVHERTKGVDRSLLGEGEVEAVAKRLKTRPFDALVVSVALHFLRYAKLHGVPLADGWNVQVSVNGVIRKWPGCRGTHSRRVIESLIASGLLRKTKERVRSSNRTGRPRTFLCRVAPELRTGSSMPHEKALVLLTKMLTETETVAEAAPGPSALPSTYRRSIPPAPRGESTESRREARQGTEKTMSVPDRETPDDAAILKRKMELFRAEKALIADLEMRRSTGRRNGRAMALSETLRSLEESSRRETKAPMVRCSDEREVCEEDKKRHAPQGGHGHAIKSGMMPLKALRRGVGVSTPEDEETSQQRNRHHGSNTLPGIGPRHLRQAKKTMGESGRRRGDLRQSPPESGRIENEDSALPEKVPGGGSGLCHRERTSDPVLEGPPRSPPIEVINGRQ